MGKKPAKQPAKAAAAAGKGAAAKGKAGKKQQIAESSSSSGYDCLRDPLDRQLALLRLRVKNITADGNCFFRALSDQLQGDEARHSELRAQVCALMSDQSDDFAPFVEDDQTLETYLNRMRKEGVWAGHMELQAASLLLECNIAVYQAGQPRWCITNFPAGSRMLHLSYHDGEHYNSVRRADDYSRGTPADIPDALTPVADVAEAQQCWSAADEKLVADGTGCDNLILIRQQLEKARGDVDAAIETVIEIMAGEGYVEASAASAAGGLSEPATAGAAAESVVGSVSAGTEAREEQGSAGESAAEAIGAAESRVVQSDVASSVADTQHKQQQQQEGELTAPDSRSSNVAVGSTEAEPAAATTAATEQPGSPAAQHDAAASDGTAAAAINGSNAAGSSSKARSSKVKGVKLRGGSSSSSSGVGTRRAAADKAPGRNKACPCGSGRKHKNCCGVGGHKGAAKPAAAQATDSLPVALGTLHI